VVGLGPEIPEKMAIKIDFACLRRYQWKRI